MDFVTQAREAADRYDREAAEEEQREEMGMEDDEDDEMIDRMEVFMPVVQSLIGALGGFEEVINPETREVDVVYRPGDSVLSVLRDLKKLWRKDDTDDERTVFRCFAKAGLCTELVALLEECTGRGDTGRKIALAAADLLAALTWPIDVQRELQDMLEDAEVVVSDYASLLRSQVEYKALMLRSGETLKSLMILLVPSLALSRRDRTDKDRRIISLMLHLVRNLLAIRDPVGSGGDTGERMELGSLQSRLIAQLEEAQFMALFLTLAENAERPEFEEYNVLILDSTWLMLRAVEVEDLTKDSSEAASAALGKLLEEENQKRQHAKRTGNTRHSRFGTTIVMKSGSDRYVLHKQSSISTTAGAVIDGIKRKRAGKATKEDELTMKSSGVTMLNQEALSILKSFATGFLQCFDSFFHSILKDIRLGRNKIRETDNLRVLFLCRFFMEYFLCLRQQQVAAKFKKEREAEMARRKAERERDPLASMGLDDDSLMTQLKGNEAQSSTQARTEVEPDSLMDFRLLAEVFQDETRGWLGKRLGEAKDAKPRGDLEIQACLDFFTQLLLVISEMSTNEDPEILELADTLSAKLLQNAEFIETAYDCLKTYKHQSMAYLDSAINFCYTLIRTLELYTKDKGQIHIRKKREMDKRKKKQSDADVNLDDEEEQAAALEKATATYSEHTRQFRDFERALADERIVTTLVRYLGRYREFRDSRKLKRLVSLMHRIVVSVGAEAFFFKVSGFEVFKKVLDDQRSLPAGQSTKDLISCITYILRKFFKALQENPLLAVEAFWPKPRGQLRKLSGRESDEDSNSDGGLPRIKVPKIPADLEFKPDKEFAWSQKLGVAMRCLMDDRKVHLIMWLVEVLREVVVERQEIILSTDGEPRVYDPDIDDVRPPTGPSEAALEKIADYVIRPNTEEQKTAITYNAHVKLLFTLVNFEKMPLAEPSSDEIPAITWLVPRAVRPSDLEASIRVIEQFLKEPMDLDGDQPADLLRRQRKRPVRRRKRLSVEDDGAERLPTRRRKQAEEVQQYKSAQFIEDSDEDPEADAAFFAREAAARDTYRKRIQLGLAPVALAITSKKKRGLGRSTSETGSEQELEGDSRIPREDSHEPEVSGRDDTDIDQGMAQEVARARKRQRRSEALPEADSASEGENSPPRLIHRPRPKKRVIGISDGEDSD